MGIAREATTMQGTIMQGTRGCGSASRVVVFAAGLFCATTAVWAPAHASALTIYDDALQNGFEDWSYGGGSNFANTSPVHAGTRSIALDGAAFNAVSFMHPGGPLAAADWPDLHLWVNGGSAGGQALTLVLQQDGAVVAQAPLNAYLPAGGPAANAWQRASIHFAAAPLGYAGAFDRIDLQSNAAGTQPTVYFDDIALDAPGSDAIFADGFDGGGAPAPNGLVIDHDVAIDGLSGDRFSWRDGTNLPRVAVLAHNDGGTGSGGTRGGELREFHYQAGAATRIVRATSDSFGGFGYVVSHAANEDHCTGGGDPSGLGHLTPGTFQRVFEGRHHAILRFVQAYPRYCTTGLPAQEYDVPVTIEWMFSSGRDDPLWSVTWDLSGAPVNRLEDDARGPYGQLRIDGAANDAARAQIAGVGWGDYYRFTSSTDPVTFDSTWSWNQPNTVPYVALWTSAVDAAMGLVQTQTITQQDAGGYWGQDLWNRSSAQVSGCPGSYLMPCDYNWPFQSINYELYGGATQNARLAWGTNFGFLGQAQYRIRGNAEYGGSGNGTALPGDPMAPGWPKKSYSTWVVLGTHTADGVDAAVHAVETLQGVALSASVGSVATQGPAGVADSTPVTYAPAGWDPLRGALTFNAAGNHLDATLAAGAGTLRHPLLIVRGFTAGAYPSLTLDGVTLAMDVDWLPSLRADHAELWITLDRDLTGSHHLVISP